MSEAFAMLKRMGNEVEYSRGYLPHWDVPGARQFLTWRLRDALSAEQWAEWKTQYYRPEDKPKLYRLAEANLDSHAGAAHFRNPALGAAVMKTLLEKQGDSYVLHAAVVMPNHVHALVTIPEGISIGDVVRSMKGASAHRVNAILGISGPLWQPDYFDRLIRNAEHFDRVKHYIHWNPVKANLSTDPKRYHASTANPYFADQLHRTEVRGPDAG